MRTRSNYGVVGSPVQIGATSTGFVASASDQSVLKAQNKWYGPPATFDYILLGGGGAGGFGGGGAGGYLTATLISNIDSLITVTVGAGGTGGGTDKSYTFDGSGTSSTIVRSIGGTITAYGGGNGGGGYTGKNGGYSVNNAGTWIGSDGASGGGSGGNADASATSTRGGRGIYTGSAYLSQARQGYDGGACPGIGNSPAGGGGGAGGAGNNGSSGSPYGKGGVGVVVPFSGLTIGQNVAGIYYIGGGGGGGAYDIYIGAGGNGGGGTGSKQATNAGSGTANTGGGGGGNGATGSCGNGGSGIVVIRIPDTSSIPQTTGSPTIVTSGGYKHYIFTQSGTLQW